MVVPASTDSASIAPQFDLAELSERSGVSARTIRYYLQEGLITPPAARGPKAKYTHEHLDRLVAIRKYQQQHLPLAEIRARLAAGDSGQNESGAKQPAESPAIAARQSSHWERITLSDDAELHVRRPLSREATKRIEQLVTYAREHLSK